MSSIVKSRSISKIKIGQDYIFYYSYSEYDILTKKPTHKRRSNKIF